MRWTALGVSYESLISDILITRCIILTAPCSTLFTPYSMLTAWSCMSNPHSNVHRDSTKKFAKHSPPWSWIKCPSMSKKSDQEVQMILLYLQFLWWFYFKFGRDMVDIIVDPISKLNWISQCVVKVTISPGRPKTMWPGDRRAVGWAFTSEPGDCARHVWVFFFFNCAVRHLQTAAQHNVIVGENLVSVKPTSIRLWPFSIS